MPYVWDIIYFPAKGEIEPLHPAGKGSAWVKPRKCQWQSQAIARLSERSHVGIKGHLWLAGPQVLYYPHYFRWLTPTFDSVPMDHWLMGGILLCVSQVSPLWEIMWACNDCICVCMHECVRAYVRVFTHAMVNVLHVNFAGSLHLKCGMCYKLFCKLNKVTVFGDMQPSTTVCPSGQSCLLFIWCNAHNHEFY